MFSLSQKNKTKSSKMFFSQKKENINTYEKIDKIFNEIITKYYNENKLYTIKIGGKTLKSSISDYFSYLITNEGKVIISNGRKQEINSNNPINDKLIFIISPPENGQNLIINEIKKKYNCYTQLPSLGFNQILEYNENNEYNLKEGDIYEDYSGAISFLESNLTCEKKKFIIFENFPIDLFLLSLKGKLFKSWINILEMIKKALINFLNSNKNNNLCIFFWSDEKLKPYQLISVFGSKIIYHEKTVLIDLNPIPETKFKSIIIEIYEKLNLNNIGNILEKIEDIYCKCNGNLYQMKQLIYYDLLYYYSNQINTINSKNNIDNNKKLKSKKIIAKKFKINKKKSDVINDKNIFHLLGKLLYNKRLVKGEKSPRKLTKNEIMTLPNELYYNLQELIDSNPISNESFLELLLENILEHVNDIEELSEIYETFSFTDSFTNFDYVTQQKNYSKIDTLNNDKIYLNCLSVVTFNLSQYNLSFNKKFTQIEKANFNYKVQYNDELYFKYAEYNPSIFGLSKKNFFTDVQWLVESFGKEMKNKNNYVKSYDEKAKEDINFYKKEKDLDMIELEKAEEGNKYNNNVDHNIINIETVKKYRNIKQEFEEKDDKLINNLLNDESSDSDSAELYE